MSFGFTTASGIVSLVRMLIREPYARPYRDGFSTDSDQNPILVPILPFINWGMRDFALQGYLKATLTFPTSPNTYQYDIDQGAGRIDFLTISGYPKLERSTERILREEFTTAFTISGAVATPQYWAPNGQQFILYPVPDAAYNMQYKCDYTPADLVNPSDIPLHVPYQVINGLAVYAAMTLARTDTENPAMATRADYLERRWAKEVENLAQVVDDRSLDELRNERTGEIEE